MKTLKPAIEPNVKQYECIKTLEGPVMVLAGPGTGKTYTIIQRIKYMLQNGITPESILCLTYSEAAANEMKARLVKEIGISASSVSVNTYHAFCSNLIKQYPEEFELLDGVSLVDEITKRSIMAEVLDEFEPEIYRTKWGDYYYFIPELLKSVDEIKSNQVTKDEYFNMLNTHPLWQGRMDELQAEYIEREQKGKLVKTFLNSFDSHKRKMGKAKETWTIFELYDKKLKQNNFIDFNDMINLVLNVLEYNQEFLTKISAQYKYFLVDEYQDTNYSQNNIVFLLSQGSNSNNIFVVGDDDQIIYEFQGAKTDTLEKFLLKYPDTKVICLNENNRSSQNILDFSYDIISQDKSRLEFNPKFAGYNISKKLTAKNPDIIPLNRKIEVHGFSDIKQENNYIVKEIENIINSDKLPLNDSNEKDLSKISILTRENSELETFASLLEAKNIQFQIKENKSIFDIKSSLLVYFYLKALENTELHADKLFGLLLSKPFEFENADYNYLLTQNRLNHKDLIYNIRKSLNSHKWENPKKVHEFIRTFDSLFDLKASLNFYELIIEMLNKTGLLAYFIDNNVNRSDNIYAIKKITDEARAYLNLNKEASLSDFLNHIDSAFESSIPILIDKDDFVQNAVQLTTLHGSKGREFDFVFIPNLIAKKWEGKKVSNKTSLPIDKDNKSVDEDSARYSEQLRLLFVGVTRAKYSLFLSYSNSIDAKPQELTSYLVEAVKNTDIVETFNHELSKDEYLNEIAQSLKKEYFNYSKAFKDELTARVKNFVLSPSSLNAYLNCPRNFLYSNILKIPVIDSISENANYGSAFHKALDNAVKYAKENNHYPTEQEFISSLNKYLDKQEFTSSIKRQEYKARIEKSGDIYYKHLVEIIPSRIYATEYYLEYVPFDKYFIKGFIDRIEKNSDATFEVYDYKTGGAKSKTQIADGKEYEGYLNQLRFYKLAFELKNPGTKVSRGGLIFVEEPDSNFYIDFTNEDNQIIQDKISFAYENIQALNFDPPSEDEQNCGYCPYRHLCRLNCI